MCVSSELFVRIAHVLLLQIDVRVSSELFVRIAHVLLLQIDGCWCGPHWTAVLPGSGLLICWPTCPL